VHRDLKPANVLVKLLNDGTYLPLVADFGLSRIKTKVAMTSTMREGGPAGGSEGLAGGSSRSLVVGATGLGGTPLYAAPEAIKSGTEVHGSQDVWSFGLMLNEIIRGESLCDDDGFME